MVNVPTPFFRLHHFFFIDRNQSTRSISLRFENVWYSHPDFRVGLCRFRSIFGS
jgi:hypothetical protein